MMGWGEIDGHDDSQAELAYEHGKRDGMLEAMEGFRAERDLLAAIVRTRKSTKGDPQALADGLACLLGDPE